MKKIIFFLSWGFLIHAMEDHSYTRADKLVYYSAKKNMTLLMRLAHLCGGRLDVVNPKTRSTPLAIASNNTRDFLLKKLGLPFSSNPINTSLFINFAEEFNPDKTTPLGFATFQGDIPLVMHLLSEKADPNARGSDGLSPLSIAIKRKRLRIANLLLDAGANANEIFADSSTPLITAAASGQLDICYLLLNFNADIMAVDNDGANALIAATKSGYHIANKLAQSFGSIVYDNNGFTAIHYAAQLGYLKILLDLLNVPININFPTKDGRTSLYLAIETSRSNVVFELLNLGADPEITPPLGMSPLQKAFSRAKQCHNKEFDPENEHLKFNSRIIIKHLLMFGAKLDTIAQEYTRYLSLVLPTDFILASATGNLLLVVEKYPFLTRNLPSGSDQDLQYILDEALILAIGQGHKLIVEFLCEKGANPSSRIERLSGLQLAQNLALRFLNTPSEKRYAEVLEYLNNHVMVNVPRRLSVFQE